MDKIDIAGIGIVALVLMESVALICGQDGALFAPIVAAVSAIVGFAYGQHTEAKKCEEELE